MRWHIAATVLFLGCSHAAPAPPPAAQRSANGDWIERSNRNAQVLLDVRARFTPELAARTGVVGIDERISDFTPGHRERLRQALREAVSTLEGRRGGERDVNVVQDLAILVDAAERQLNGSELQEKLEVPYANVPRLVFGSVRGLLDPQVAPERRPAALARVRKYAGIEQGYRPVVELAEAETREGFR